MAFLTLLPLWTPISPDVRELHSGKTTHSVVHCAVSRPLLQAYTSDHPADQIRDWQQSWQISPTSEVTCRACGCSDNTIGHWTRWCPVPLIVALSILRPTRRVDNIGQLARMGVKHAVTCTLVLASFRRLLRQEGAFLHQTCSDPRDVLWWITTLHEMVPLIHTSS